jgi:hypothetical protein
MQNNEVTEISFNLTNKDFPSPVEITIVNDEVSGVSSARGHLTYDDITFDFYGNCVYVDVGDSELSKYIWSIDDGKKAIGINWGGGTITKKGNPVILKFTSDEIHGMQIILENVESASDAQINEMKPQKRIVKRMLKFKQAQKGGRKKRSRPKKTIKKYRRMMNLRNSMKWRERTDKEFLDAHPEYNRSSLNRAKRWAAEGRPE